MAGMDWEFAGCIPFRGILFLSDKNAMSVLLRADAPDHDSPVSHGKNRVWIAIGSIIHGLVFFLGCRSGTA